MKKLIQILALACFIAVGVRAQTVVTTLTMIGTNPTFDAKGTLLTAPVQAMFQSVTTIDDKMFTSPQNVTWDGTDQKTTVTVGGVTLTYYQVTQFAAAIANQELAKAPGTQSAAAAEAKAKAGP